MAYCPNCGVSVDGYVPAQPQEPTEVTLARIDADARVEVARLEASARRAELVTAEAVAEVQADADVEVAEANAVALTALVEAEAAEPEPEPAAPEPVIISQVNDDEAEQDVSPPPVDHEPTERAKRGLGMW